MQGGVSIIIKAEKHSKTFQKTIKLWKQQTENDNFANFPLLYDCISEIKNVFGNPISVPTELKQAFSLHLDELTKSLDEYFPIRESYAA